MQDLSAMEDADGVLLQGIEVTTPDGQLTLRVSAGTTMLTKDGDPLQYLMAEVLPDWVWSDPPQDQVIVAAYYLEPEGARFDPPMTMTVIYNPASLPEGVFDEQLVVAGYDSAAEQWSYRPPANRDGNTITVSVEHFTVFAILVTPFEPTPSPEPTSTAQPTSTPEPTPAPESTPMPELTATPEPTPTPMP